MFSDHNYSVEIEDYAQRHYIKGFAKRYVKGWDVTCSALIAEVEHIDRLCSETDRGETIHINGNYKIAKVYFRVAGTRESAKGSGNRAIVFVNEEDHNCKILLVYCKNDIGPPRETQKWETEVRDNYPEYWGFFTLKN